MVTKDETQGATLKQRVIRVMVGQFGHPRGVGGRMAGWIMAHRGSNRQRNRWAVSLLGIAPQERVLEVGFGPGVAIAELARQASQGHVYGIDHSELMVRRASRRNRAAVRAGRVTLIHASADRLPPFGEPFDAILTVNSLAFWPQPARSLDTLRRLLRPGGRIALVTQPRCPGATTDHATRASHDLLTQAGFTQVRHEILDLDPPVTCVLATNPG